MSGGVAPAEVASQYRALRTGVGAHWLARDLVRVAGPDAVSYLQGQLSQDVANLAIGATAASLILSPQGKIDALVRVTRTAEAEVLLDTDDGWGEAVVERLVRFRMRTKVDVEALAWRCLGVRGPAAGRALAEEGPIEESPIEESMVVPAQWPGAAGFDILGAEVVVPAGVPVCGDEAWEALRVEAGVARMGSELTERTIPAETALVGDTVSFTKGCFTGQELVARIDARGNRVPRHLRGVVVGADELPPVGAALRLGEALASGEPPGPDAKVVGSLTSVTWSPGLGVPVALAFVRREVDPPADVVVTWDDDHPGLLRSRAVPGRVRALPLEVTLD